MSELDTNRSKYLPIYEGEMGAHNSIIYDVNRLFSILHCNYQPETSNLKFIGVNNLLGLLSLFARVNDDMPTIAVPWGILSQYS